MTDKQRALVTGASRGIGLELARLFAADGHDLILVARSADSMHALAGELRAAHGVEVRVEPVDLRDAASRAALCERLADVQVDVLVNNAGFGSTGAFHELDVDGELAQIEVNVCALTDLTGRLLPGMVARGRGRVLNIASTAGFQAGPYMAVYYATKAYVIAFTEAIAFELKGTGVTATAHCPGATHTSFAAAAGNDTSKLFTAGSVAAAEDVARHAYAAMWGGKPLAIHGATNWLGAFMTRFGPRSVSASVAARLNRA
jgi:short-subunit dehydrogenase